MSEASIRKIRSHLHALFAFGVTAGVIASNPAAGARARGQRRSSRRVRGTQLTPQQVKDFLAVCSPRWRLFFTVALDTGLRRGELIGLRWGDVDLLQRIIHVRRSIGEHDLAAQQLEDDQERLRPKTQAGVRLVPILDGAQRALEELYRSAPEGDEDAPVFATVRRVRAGDGATREVGATLDPRMVSRVFRRYAQRAGLRETIRLHDLRHTAITGAIAQGESILLVSAFAGHAKTSTTVNIYAHLMPAHVARAARRMRSVSPPATPVQARPLAPAGQPPVPSAPPPPQPRRARPASAEWPTSAPSTPTAQRRASRPPKAASPVSAAIKVSMLLEPSQGTISVQPGSSSRSC